MRPRLSVAPAASNTVISNPIADPTNPGAINDTLSWTTIRPLGVLPLDARCRPTDLRFEDGEQATGPPLSREMWGTCNTVRRLNGGPVCDAAKDPAACPSLDGDMYGEQDAFGCGVLRGPTRKRGWPRGSESPARLGGRLCAGKG
jgi:hypothetical protein